MMATRADAIDRVREHFHSGEFLRELDKRVGYQTESQNPGRGDALRAYLTRTCSRLLPSSILRRG